MAHSCLSTNSPSLSTLNTRFSSIDSVPTSISSWCWRVKCGGGRSGRRRWVAVRAEGGGAVKEEAEKEGGVRRGVWSIRDDLPLPSSPYLPAYAETLGPSPLAYARLQSTISELFQYRIIRCGGPVDDGMANIIVAQLLYLDAIDPTKDIVMYINSPGGSVTAGMAIYDTMRHIRPDVSTVCIGLAASMAAFLLGAGTKGKRYSLPNSRIMIHQPMGDVQGSLMEQEVQGFGVMEFDDLWVCAVGAVWGCVLGLFGLMRGAKARADEMIVMKVVSVCSHFEDGELADEMVKYVEEEGVEDYEKCSDQPPFASVSVDTTTATITVQSHISHPS